MSGNDTDDLPLRRDAPATRGQQRRQVLEDDDDNVSALSEENTATSKHSIWSAAAMILKGENPEAIPEETENDDDILGLSVPIANGETSRSSHKQSRSNGTSNVRWKSPVNEHVPNNNNNNNTERLATSSSSSTGIDFLHDAPSEMTYSRRLAVWLMQRYAWYNPRLVLPHNHEIPDALLEQPGDSMHPVLLAAMANRKKQQQQHLGEDDERHPVVLDSAALASSAPEQRLLLEAYPFTHSRRENPSLAKAWAYFDHVTLSRYVVTDDDKSGRPKKCCLTRCFRKLCCKAGKMLQRAEPGEREYPTALYEPIFTPHGQLGDFGLGIGLYFSTLRAITVLTLLAGLLNIPNFLYYGSSEYNPGLSNFDSMKNETVQTLLQGSAICTDFSWVVCDDCKDADFKDNRRANGTHQSTGLKSDFYLRTNCPSPSIQTSMINYASLILIMVGTIVLNMYLRRMEVAFDEDEQTAQDYSIVISNPPGDATDPSEWHNFFRDAFDGAHVTACTVAVDNDLLVRSLVERREKLRQIEMMLEPGTSLDTLTLAGIAAKQERERRFIGHLLAVVSPGIPELFARLTVLTAKVQGLAQQDYPATNIFVTFETERDQRKVLSAYNVGSLDVKRNNTASIDSKHLFRGKLVLKVVEPDEPNTVRWQDLNVNSKEKLKQQLLTALATAVAIFVIAVLVYVLQNKPPVYTAFTIAIFNTVFPMFAKMLTDCEAHASEGHKQRSLYFKIAMFRWVNTAIVITIITPFTSTLTNGELVNRIYALFLADIITSNAIQLLDPMGHLSRHFLAPRAATQDAMNLKMSGQVFELAERYTNMTKILFLALWYCAIYPGALLMCSFALFINYFTDRFSLMRTWKRAPQLGTKISEFSRRYFFSLAIVAMAVLSSYYWAGFPFDNLCLEENPTANASYVGEWTITPFNHSETVDIMIPTDGEVNYKYCPQDFFRFPKADKAFPFIPEFQLEGQEWMTTDQELVTNIFGWSSVGVLVIIVLSFVYGWYHGFMGLFRGSYDARGEDQGINFSDVPSINSYIPEVKSPVFSYPLLACNIDSIDEDLLEWHDPDRPHAFYDLTKDAEVLLHGTDVSSKIVFTQIAHWPPEKKSQKAA